MLVLFWLETLLLVGVSEPLLEALLAMSVSAAEWLDKSGDA